MKNQVFKIAIDGPVAAGKGTVARILAERLGFLYVDTGAMYRVATLLALENSCDLENGQKIAEQIAHVALIMRNPLDKERDGRQTTILIDDQDVSWKIRTEHISSKVSQVAKHPQVRQVLVAKQQHIAQSTSVVMEGRDITYRVLPQADLKIYLTADDDTRAKRRHQELLIRGEDVSYQDVLQNLKERDYQDTHRIIDPLKIVEDAWVLNTTDLSIQEVVNRIESRVVELQGNS